MNSTSIKTSALVAAFALTVPLANWSVGHIGICTGQGPCVVPVGFGLYAPSGVLLIGAALALRDAVQDSAGLRWVTVAIALGCALSFLTAPPALALASAVAFIVSEALDTAIYTPLRKRQMVLAVLLSGLAGAVVDSLLFTQIAFGTTALAAGTVLGKVYASASYAVFRAVTK